MPEGDTLFRTAAILRDVLVGRVVTGARGRAGGARLERLVGQRVAAVTARGKHLLVSSDGGLSLHSHLGLHGSWHRYRPDERWRLSPSRAAAVVEVPGAVAVCFDAPTVELLESRALAIHPGLRWLGADLITTDEPVEVLVARLRALPAATPVGEALLDQRALAGLGNVYRSEVCFLERIDPFRPLAQLDEATLARLIATARRLIRANRLAPARSTVPHARDPGERLWVYGRTGRPCRRCGTPIRSRTAGERPRRTWWCPNCQA
jgi:endonuclease-8